MIINVDLDVDDILADLGYNERKELAKELFREFNPNEIDTDNLRQLVYLAQMECLNMKLPHYLRELLYQTTGAEFGV